jgi:YD repeat-containing protein
MRAPSRRSSALKKLRPILSLEMLEERNSPTPWSSNQAITLIDPPEPAVSQATQTAEQHDFLQVSASPEGAPSPLVHLAAPSAPLASPPPPITVAASSCSGQEPPLATPAPGQESFQDFVAAVTDFSSSALPPKRNPLRPLSDTDMDSRMAAVGGGQAVGLPPDASQAPTGMPNSTSGGAPTTGDATSEQALADAAANAPASSRANTAVSSSSALSSVPAGATAPSPWNVSLPTPPVVRPPVQRGPHLNNSADPLWVLDANKAIVVTPGVTEHEFSTRNMDLRAQVSGATVATYNWDLSQAPEAASVAGQGTYRLQFSWASFTGAARTDTITLTTTNTDNSQQTQVLTFQLDGTDSPAWTATPPTTAGTWPTVVTPDQLTGQQEMVGEEMVGANSSYSVGLATGELQLTHTLPAYNVNVPPLELVYSSSAVSVGNSLSFLVHYQLDPSQPVPSTITAKLTIQGLVNATVYYNTASLNPGDTLQLVLQNTGSSFSGARFSFQIDVTANYATPVTSTFTGKFTYSTGNLRNNPLGTGWSLAGLERIRTATGGVVLDLGAGRSLWFATAGGNNYVTPAGDFSTLVHNANGSFVRTLPDGTTLNFNGFGYETSAVDRNGNTIAYSYDANNNLTAITDPYGGVSQLAYNSQGYVSSITDPAGRVTQLGYDTAGTHLTSITDPDPDGAGPLAAPSTMLSYNSTGVLTRLTDPRANTTSFTYSAAGHVASVTRPDNSTEQLAPGYLQGLAAAGTGTSTNPATPVLAAQAQASYTDGRNNVWTTRLDWLGFGQALQASDPLSDMTVQYRDANGLVWLVSNPLGNRSRYLFDAKGNPTKITLPDTAVELYSYNSFSEPTQYTDPGAAVTSYSYDAKGNLLTLTEADPDGSGPLTSPVTNYTYTGRGRVATMTDPDNHTTSYAYDSRDELIQTTNPDHTTVLPSYDNAGNVASQTTERGYVTTYVHDNLNRLTQETLPDQDFNPNNNPQYLYTYDAAGNQTSVTDPLGHMSTATFDSLNRLASTTDPLAETTQYGYDAADNLITVTDPLNRISRASYDPANRVVASTNPLTQTTTFTLDAAGENLVETNPLTQSVYRTYTARGQLASIRDALGDEVDYSYNACGCLLTSTELKAGVSLTLQTSYGYDRLDRRTSVTDPLNHTTAFAFDAANNETSTTDPLNHTTQFGFDARNRQITTTNPLGQTTTVAYDFAGNAISTTDPLNRLTQAVYDAQNRPILTLDANLGQTLTSYDLAGRVVSVTDADGNVTQYGYDNADRVIQMTDPFGHASTYSYDVASQLVAKTDRDGRQTAYSYDGAGRETSEKWLDGQGNSIHTFAFSYNVAGQLTAASDPASAYSYSYDAAGRLTGVDNQGTPGVPHVVLTYGYTPYDQRGSLTDNLGGDTEYGYYNDQRLGAFLVYVNNVLVATVGLGYDAAGRLTNVIRSVADTDPWINSTYAFTT